MTIVYHCLTCESYHKHHKDDKNYDRGRLTRFEYFSDAHKHMMEHPDHWMETKIETDDEE